MASSIAAKTICTVHSIQDTGFLHDPHNDQFLVNDEDTQYAPDPYASRASSFSPSVYSETEEQTPTQTTTEPFLRITTDHTPRDPTAGFVFGRDPSSCDILLAWGRKKISSRHFSVGANSKGKLALKNCSARYTLVDSAAMGKIKLESQTAIPEDGAEAEIQPPNCMLKIKIRFPSFTEPGFAGNWTDFLDRLSFHVPDLLPLKLQTTTLSSYYRGEKLGSGTSGTVYRVRHRFTGQSYALKEFDGSKPAGIFSEATILRGLSHPHIVAFEDYFMNKGPPSLVMELVDGGNLREAHNTEPLSPSELRDSCSQLLAALAYLHDKKHLIHRDVKPANIMVKFRDPIFIQLSDFGLACKADNPDRYHQGTPRYAAPEMMARKRYTCKVDIWSLGIIALELSTGLPTGYRGAEGTCLSTLKNYLRSSQTLVLQFISSLLCEIPGDRPSASQSSSHPFLSSEPQPGPPLALYELGLNQSTQILAADEEPTNPFTPPAPDTEDLVETMAHVPNTEPRGGVAYTAGPWSRSRGGDSDVAGTSPGTYPRHGDGHRRKRTAHPTRGKPGKRRARQTPDTKQPIESQDPGSNPSTVIHCPLNSQALECSFQTCSDGETIVIDDRLVDIPDIDREDTDPSALPAYHPWDRQAEISHISYYTERACGDVSYLAPQNLSFQQVQFTTQAHTERADIQHRSPPLDIANDPTYNESVYLHGLGIQPANLVYAQDPDVNTAPADDASAEDLTHLSSRSAHKDDKGWYVVVRRHKICMRASDFFLNASKMWAAARSSKTDSKRHRHQLRAAKALLVEGSYLWVPVKEGKFLAEALGLDEDLRDLFLHAPKSLLPRGEENYLLKRRHRRQPTEALGPKPEVDNFEFNFFPWKNRWIAFQHNDDGDHIVNITQILQAAGLGRRKISRPTGRLKDLLSRKQIRHGNTSFQGTFIPYEHALGICQYFEIDSPPLMSQPKEITNGSPLLKASEVNFHDGGAYL